VDRASGFVKISIPTTKKADEIQKESVRLLSPFKEITHTITSDNGLEFANHESISKILDCDYYFCHPYSSWERGLNEYTNGLIRQYIPKGSSFNAAQCNSPLFIRGTQVCFTDPTAQIAISFSLQSYPP